MLILELDVEQAILLSKALVRYMEMISESREEDRFVQVATAASIAQQAKDKILEMTQKPK